MALNDPNSIEHTLDAYYSSTKFSHVTIGNVTYPYLSEVMGEPVPNALEKVLRIIHMRIIYDATKGLVGKPPV